MKDLSEKIGITVMICLLLLLIGVISFNFEDNINQTNLDKHSLNKSSLLNKSIINESQLNNTTFNDSIDYGIYIQDMNNKTIFDLNSNKKYSSPITMNLILNLAILDKYDANANFNISVYKNGEIINGSLYGDLILVPEGNPNILEISTLNYSSELKNISKQIKEYGINKINGNILIDNNNSNYTNNLTVTIFPSNSAGLANVTINSTSDYNIISNITTINYTANESIDILNVDNNTIILNGLISNDSKPINLEIPINGSNKLKYLFINSLTEEKILINNVDIDYDGIYKEILLRNSLINSDMSDFSVNNSKLDVKNSNLLINVSFNKNFSKYDLSDRVAFIESKPLIDFAIHNLINFNESINYDLIYLLDNNSNKTFDNELKNLNNFLYTNNISKSNNSITKEDYYNNKVSLELSNNLLIYLYNQKYFDDIYNNMSNVNETSNIKTINNTIFYENHNINMLNQSIMGYINLNSSKLAFIIYLNNVTISNDNMSKKNMDDVISFLEKVYEKYN